MARNFKELETKMRPESRARVKTRAREMMAEMLLAKIRAAQGFTQEQLAAALGIKQPSLSRLESQHDMQIGTLRRLIEALGGELELIAHLPGCDVRIQLHDEAA